MSTRASVLSDWLAQRIDRTNGQPIYRQLHRLLQQAILTRELAAGAKVPSSRLLAAELGVARNTVTQVYEQLALEGYVSSATGAAPLSRTARPTTSCSTTRRPRRSRHPMHNRRSPRAARG